MHGRELSVPEHVHRPIRLRRGREGVGLGANRGHHQPGARHAEARGHEVGVGPGVAQHDVGEPQGGAIDTRQHHAARTAHAAAIAREGVGERDHHVGHQQRMVALSHHPRGHGVGLGRVPGDDRIGVPLGVALHREARPGTRVRRARLRQAHGRQEPARLVRGALPHRAVALVHLHAEGAQAVHQHAGTRVVTFVRAHPLHSQRAGHPSMMRSMRDAASSSSLRSRPRWISSLTRPMVKSWMPTTMSSTARMSSGLPPMASPRILMMVR